MPAPLQVAQFSALLVVVDGLDILGATAFSLDEEGLIQAAQDLERLLPQP
jgi:hypothetical protein